jgi:hypothetical protein
MSRYLQSAPQYDHGPHGRPSDAEGYPVRPSGKLVESYQTKQDFDRQGPWDVSVKPICRLDVEEGRQGEKEKDKGKEQEMIRRTLDLHLIRRRWSIHPHRLLNLDIDPR